MFAFWCGLISGLGVAGLFWLGRTNAYIYISLLGSGFFAGLIAVELVFFAVYRNYERDRKGNRLSLWDYINWKD